MPSLVGSEMCIRDSHLLRYNTSIWQYKSRARVFHHTPVVRLRSCANGGEQVRVADHHRSSRERRPGLRLPTENTQPVASPTTAHPVAVVGTQPLRTMGPPTTSCEYIKALQTARRVTPIFEQPSTLSIGQVHITCYILCTCENYTPVICHLGRKCNARTVRGEVLIPKGLYISVQSGMEYARR